MVKQVTFEIEESLLEAAQKKARREHSSLEEQLHRWLARYVAAEEATPHQLYAELMARLSYAEAPDGKLTRDELNERQDP